MSISSLPPYPNPSVERGEDLEGNRDWGLLLSRLLVIGAVGVFIGVVLFAFVLVVSAGQILRFFDRPW